MFASVENFIDVTSSIKRVSNAERKNEEMNKNRNER